MSARISSVVATLLPRPWQQARLLATSSAVLSYPQKPSPKTDKRPARDKAAPPKQQSKQLKQRRPNYYEDPYLLTEKLGKLYRADKTDEAFALLQEVPRRAQSPVIWNELIQAYGRAGQGKKAWRAYNQMKKRGFTPTGETFTNLLNAFARSSTVSVALTDAVLRAMTHTSSATDTFEDVCGRLSQIHLNVALKVYARVADAPRLDRIVGALRERQRIDTVTASILITTFARMNEFDRAWDIWKNDVRLGGIPVDSKLVGAILLACSRVDVKDAQHRAFFIADRYLGLGEHDQPSGNNGDEDGGVYIAPTPANMDSLMLCCGRLKQFERGYEYFCRALTRYATTGMYRPDMHNFLSGTGLILSRLREIREDIEYADDQ